MILRPLKAIREKCRDCCGCKKGEYAEITHCPFSPESENPTCPLYQLRFGKKPKGLEYVYSLQDRDKGQLSPLKAMRAYCLDCCCGSAHEVNLCPADNCPLYPYRFGRRPDGVSEDEE